MAISRLGDAARAGPLAGPTISPYNSTRRRQITLWVIPDPQGPAIQRRGAAIPVDQMPSFSWLLAVFIYPVAA